MKKAFYLLAALLTFAACEGPRGPMGPQGPKGEPGDPAGGTSWQIIDKDIPAGEWQVTNTEQDNFYYADFDLPQLTEDIYNDGLVQVYLEYNTGYSDATQVLLPATRHFEYKNSDGSWGYYSATTDYEYGIGNMSVYVTFNDFALSVREPGDMHLRIVLMY